MRTKTGSGISVPPTHFYGPSSKSKFQEVCRVWRRSLAGREDWEWFISMGSSLCDIDDGNPLFSKKNRAYTYSFRVIWHPSQIGFLAEHDVFGKGSPEEIPMLTIWMGNSSEHLYKLMRCFKDIIRVYD